MQKKRNVNNKVSRASVLVFAAGLAVTMLALGYLIHVERENREKDVYRIKEVYAARLETRLNNLFHKTDVLEAVILAFGDRVSEEVFQEVAKSLDTDTGIRAIQYLPGGTVEYCYPVEGNEEAIGDNVFENPERREAALLALETRDIALSGPYELLQGGFGLIVRNPVFITDEKGKESFWGFAVLILDLPEAIRPVGMEELKNTGYAYRLSCIMEDGREVIVEEAGSIDRKQTMNTDIEVPNHVWTLSIMPEKGWIDWKRLALLAFVGVLFSFLCANRVNSLYNRQKMFRYFAVMDELTGLLNRRGILEASEHFFRDHIPFMMVYMDLNKFKSVNDTYGHTTGDELLREVAGRMERYCASGEACGRIGGDEFIIMVPLREKKNEEFVSGLKKALEYPFHFSGLTLDVSMSVGTACYPEEGGDYDSLLKNADERMYADKAGKRRQP